MLDINVRGRHTGVAQRFRDYADEKLAKIERFDSKVMRVDVEVSKERNPRLSDRRERVELTCHTRGPTIRAEAAADDRYAALDQALARLKERLRKMCDRRKIHHGTQTPKSVAEATADTLAGSPVAVRDRANTPSGGKADAPVPGTPDPSATSHEYVRVADDEPDQAVVPLETDGGAPLVVREKIHRAKPMTIDQALFEMELVGHDFFLFRDRDSGHPSVVYRRRGFDYGVLRLEE